MNADLALPLVAALISIASASVMLALSWGERANRVGALLMASVAWWAGCEVMWRQAADASSAMLWHRLAAPGIVFLGAHAAWFLAALSDPRLPRLARAVPAIYALNALFLGAAWFGPLMFTEMRHTRFGWMLVPGPLLAIWYVQLAGVVAFALGEWVRASSRSRHPGGLYARQISICAALAAIAAGVSDVLLAGLGVELPRVGSLLVSLIGVAVLFVLTRAGFSRLNAAGLSQRIVRLLPDGIALVQPSGRILVANPSMAQILGCEPEDVEGRSIADALDLPILDTAVEYRAQECELRQDIGFSVPVSVSTARIPAVGMRDDGLLLIVRDEREVAALRRRLSTTERLAVVGQLAGGIAHEINNPLAYVRANLHHLERELGQLAEKSEAGGEPRSDLVDELEEIFAESLGGIDRAIKIVSDVRTFADAGGDAHRSCDLGEVIDQALGVTAMGLPSRVHLHRPSLPEGGLQVMGSPQRLKQLFANLVLNAIQAVGESGSIRIEARSAGAKICVEVIDDGPGMKSEDLTRIFEPFYTTRQTEGGTGLGLAVCHEIARSHGGSIEAQSLADRGTRIAVTLPAMTEASGR